MPQVAQTAPPNATPTHGANGAATHQDVRAVASMTDEEILGMDRDVSSNVAPAFRPAGVSQQAGEEETDAGLKPSATEAPAAETAPRAPEDAQAIAKIFPQGVEAAKAAAAGAEQLAKLDAAYFSGDAKSQGELAAYLYSAEPRAFAGMLAQAARVLAERDPAAYAAARAFAPPGSVGAELASARPPANSLDKPPLQQTNSGQVSEERAAITKERQQLRVERFQSFQQSANDAVVAQVQRSLEATLAKTLPENVSGAARQRIAQDIFLEVHGALAQDRTLAQQVANIIAQERYDDAAREQVAALVLSRARTVMPDISRRVVGEWTSGVVAAHRQRSEKQDAASRRVELTGGGAPENVPRRGLSSDQVRRMSDEQILDY